MDNFEEPEVDSFVAIAESNLARLSACLQGQVGSDTIDCKFLSDCIFQNQRQTLRQTAFDVYFCVANRFGVTRLFILPFDQLFRSLPRLLQKRSVCPVSFFNTG